MNHVSIPKDPDSSVQLRPLVDFRAKFKFKTIEAKMAQKEINDLLMRNWKPDER